jgi:hypothetical protein
VDALDAALRQLAEQAEQLNGLDQREAGHFRAIGERLVELTSLVTGLGETVCGQAAILARLQGLDEQVVALAACLAGSDPADNSDGESAGKPRAYRPVPVPRWWKLRGQAREQAVARLAGWVEQVYRPGYGQLAATLGPCWASHPLCLYALDIASELWSVLYLQASRTPGVLSAQAEYQARILPALAEQMMTETTRCGHAQHRATLNGATAGKVRRP